MNWFRERWKKRPTLWPLVWWTLNPPRLSSKSLRHYPFIICNDKIVFGQHLRESSVRTCNDRLVVKADGSIRCATDISRTASLAELADGRYFVKPPYGDKGRGIFDFTKSDRWYLLDGRRMREAEALDELAASAAPEPTKCILIQEAIRQHPGMDEISPFAVNTIRMVTVKRPRGRPRLLHAVMKVSRRGSIVDNVGVSGGYVLLVRNGFTQGPGIDKFGVKHEVHGDTGKPLSPHRIPMWDEAVALCLKAHATLPALTSLGWDVAISDTGPVIIENNIGWAPSLHTRVDKRMGRALRLEALKLLPEVAMTRLRYRLRG